LLKLYCSWVLTEFICWSRLLEDFQIGEAPTFMEHVKAGVDELVGNERAILVFSG
jgi:hypothetical protein